MVGRSNRSGRAIAEFPLARKTVPEKPARLRAAVALEYGNGKPAQATLKRSLGTRDVLQDRFVCQRCAHRARTSGPTFRARGWARTIYLRNELACRASIFRLRFLAASTKAAAVPLPNEKPEAGFRRNLLRAGGLNASDRSSGTQRPAAGAQIRYFAIAPVRRRSKMSHIWHALVPIVFNEQTYAGDGHENEHVACSWLSSCRDGSWGCPAGHAGEGR